LPINFHSGFAILVIGGKHFTKQIPDNILIELCKTTKIPLLLLGGKEDWEKAENIRKSADNRDIFNACGIYNINQSASLIEKSKLIITSDTGLMHIASAFNIKIISVWGNTVPAFGMYPYLPKEKKSEIIQVKGLNCRPCSKIGFEKCPKKHFNCMKKIDISLLNKHLQ
jgi:ADP-heptose:LPS heptosyltransferase